ncbi:hypothetical protein HMPREF1618_03109 [Escherichia coli 908691]|nr:hypothetical protein HMPREF1618_03109 [Escherichia coli 908691]
MQTPKLCVMESEFSCFGADKPMVTRCPHQVRRRVTNRFHSNETIAQMS